MSAYHIDPLVLTHYHRYRAKGRKPAAAWRCAIDYARSVHNVIVMVRQRRADLRWFADRVGRPS